MAIPLSKNSARKRNRESQPTNRIGLYRQLSQAGYRGVFANETRRGDSDLLGGVSCDSIIGIQERELRHVKRPSRAMLPKTTQQLNARPILRWRPDRVRGTPICREIFPLSADRPEARLHENDIPNFLPIITVPLFDHAERRLPRKR